MNKNDVLYYSNVLLALSFLLAGVTGVIKFLGVNGVALNVPWGVIGKIHDIGGIVMILLVALHLALNWGWIFSMTKRKFSKGGAP